MRVEGKEPAPGPEGAIEMEHFGQGAEGIHPVDNKGFPVSRDFAQGDRPHVFGDDVTLQIGKTVGLGILQGHLRVDEQTAPASHGRAFPAAEVQVVQQAGAGAPELFIYGSAVSRKRKEAENEKGILQA